jgi:hypothetical protein
LIALRSYKIRFHDRHVRAVPRTDLDGCPFAGPGVDLRGDDAERAMAAARPIVAWLEAREPDVVVRSIAIDRDAPRALVTLEAEPRPRVIRVDGVAAADLCVAARDFEIVVAEAAERALRRRLGR